MGKYSHEKGQSLMIVALLFMVVSGLVLLLLDGSTFYVANRQAQLAAIAGAQAGSSYYCEHLDAIGGVNQAVEFALKNGADDPPQVVLNPSSGSVVVTASVKKSVFFPSLVGFPQVAPHAVAEVFCNPPDTAGAQP